MRPNYLPFGSFRQVCLCQTVTWVTDSISIIFSLWLVVASCGAQWSTSHSVFGLVAALSFIFLSDSYRVTGNGTGAVIENEVIRILFIWTLFASILVFVGFATTETSLSFILYPLSFSAVGAIWILIAPLGIILMRIISRPVLALIRASNEKTIGIVGGNELGNRLEKTIASRRRSGFRLTGFYDDRKIHRCDKQLSTKLEHKGDLNALYEDAKSGKLDVVYITFPLNAEDRINRIITLLADTAATVHFIPSFLVFPVLTSRWSDLNGLPVVSIFETPFSPIDNMIKRAIDITLSVIILTILFIPMLLIALSVKLTSPGPIIFRQRRYGIHGEQIKVCKFRTMSVCEDGEHIKQATHNDGRITSLGAFLRKNSLDELPQFFNVLQGGMSIVGPRPHAISHNEFYRERIPGYMLRHRVKPGITGLAQVNGCRGETETIEKMGARVRFDLEYIRQWSLWLDAKIFVKTIFHVLRGESSDPRSVVALWEPSFWSKEYRRPYVNDDHRRGIDTMASNNVQRRDVRIHLRDLALKPTGFQRGFK